MLMAGQVEVGGASKGSLLLLGIPEVLHHNWRAES